MWLNVTSQQVGFKLKAYDSEAVFLFTAMQHSVFFSITVHTFFKDYIFIVAVTAREHNLFICFKFKKNVRVVVIFAHLLTLYDTFSPK